MIGRVFDCADPCVWEGANKLLFRHVLCKPEFPERFLVVFRSESVGRFRVGILGWRSPDTWLISPSECSTAQECMFVNVPEELGQDRTGIFVLLIDRERLWLARAILANNDHLTPNGTESGNPQSDAIYWLDRKTGTWYPIDLMTRDSAVITPAI